MAKEKKVNQLKRRHLFVLEHLFDGMYERVEPMPYDEYMALVTHTDVESNKGFGSKLMHAFVRFNDIHGIHYKIDEKENPKKDDLSCLLSAKRPVNQEPVTDNTIAKNLRSLVDDHKILVHGEFGTQRNVRLYYPNESIEGLDRLVDYLLKLKFDLYSDFDNRCRAIIRSRYAGVVLNRQYIITKFREKGMRFELKMKLPDGTKLKGEVPFLGSYRKVFENPKPIEKLKEVAIQMMAGFAEKLKEDHNPREEMELQHMKKAVCAKYFGKLEHVVEKCQEALENIERINAELKGKRRENRVEDDVLTYLSMDRWFELDPDSVLRCEALWEDAVISDKDLDDVIPLMEVVGSEGRKRVFSQEDAEFIKNRYREEAEKLVTYALACSRFSFYAMAFFRRFSSGAVNKMWECRLRRNLGVGGEQYENPFEGLENTPAYPDVSKGTPSRYEWESQMLRCVLSDYVTGLGNSAGSASVFLGVGSIYDGRERIPSLVSFRLDRSRIMTVDGNLRNSFTGMDMRDRFTPMPLGVEIRIHGDKRGVPSLFEMAGEHMWGDGNPKPLLIDLLESIYSDGTSDYDVEKAILDYSENILNKMRPCAPAGDMRERYE